MKRAISFTAAAAMAATIMATTITSADAGRRERYILGGVAAGIITGAIIAGTAATARERRRDREYRWDRHVDRCYRAYRSYDEATDTWVDRRGRVRRCRL